jgi:hypothetical protein
VDYFYTGTSASDGVPAHRQNQPRDPNYD